MDALAGSAAPTTAAILVATALLAGCSGPDEGMPPAPLVFVPTCEESEAPPGAVVADVDQDPNEYEVEAVGDPATGWSVRATITAPRGSNATVRLESPDGTLWVAEAIPSEQPLHVEPLCEGISEFAMASVTEPGGRLLVTFIEAAADAPVDMPVSVHEIMVVEQGEGLGFTVAPWIPPNATTAATVTAPGHYLPGIAFEPHGSNLRVNLWGDALGVWVLSLRHESTEGTTTTLTDASGGSFAPPGEAPWSVQASGVGEAVFLVQTTGGGGTLKLEHGVGGESASCITLDMHPSRAGTRIAFGYTSGGCPSA